MNGFTKGDLFDVKYRRALDATTFVARVEVEPDLYRDRDVQIIGVVGPQRGERAFAAAKAALDRMLGATQEVACTFVGVTDSGMILVTATANGVDVARALRLGGHVKLPAPTAEAIGGAA